MMTPERWRRIEDLYHAAAARPSPERASFLDEACGAETELRAYVESLLQAENSLLLERPAIETEAQRLAREMSASATVPSLGERYELLEEIGRGGMGVVYKAHDNETRGTIAIKILNPTTAGDPRALERFQTE